MGARSSLELSQYSPRPRWRQDEPRHERECSLHVQCARAWHWQLRSGPRRVCGV